MDTLNVEVNLWDDEQPPAPVPPRIMVHPQSLDYFVDDLYSEPGYHRLTPRIWAWIRARVASAYNAFAAHKLDFDAWLEIDAKVHPIRKFAMDNLNVDEVMAAIRANEDLP